jgi:hypothetical protein
VVLLYIKVIFGVALSGVFTHAQRAFARANLKYIPGWPPRNTHAKDESRAGRRRSHHLTLFSNKHGTRVNSGPSRLLAKSGLQKTRIRLAQKNGLVT